MNLQGSPLGITVYRYEFINSLQKTCGFRIPDQRTEQNELQGGMHVVFKETSGAIALNFVESVPMIDNRMRRVKHIACIAEVPWSPFLAALKFDKRS